MLISLFLTPFDHFHFHPTLRGYIENPSYNIIEKKSSPQLGIEDDILITFVRLSRVIRPDYIGLRWMGE